MTLFKLALKNVRRNFHNYFIYFVSMVFSIMIYYIFTSIKYNEQVLALANAWHRIQSAFTVSSYIIGFFAAIFIWYSNAFFIRKRKKEVGLYSLMGVKKRQIGAMLFYENIFMGIAALVVGIGLGSLFSKLFIMLLVKLMGFSIYINFAIAPQAILATIYIYLILFLLTSIHGYTIIYRFKLVDLFKAEQQGDQEPKGSVFKALMAVAGIGGGYLFYLMRGVLSIDAMLITLTLVVIGTYFFFSSLTLFLIRLARRNKKRYFTGVNMIGSSQLLHRIKRHSRTLATIAILSATTLTAMGVTSSFYYDLKAKLDERYPFSYTYQTTGPTLDNQIKTIVNQHPDNPLQLWVEAEFIQLNGHLPKVTGHRVWREHDQVYLISVSKFNQIMQHLERMEPVQFAAPNEAAVIDTAYIPQLMESYLGKDVALYLEQGEERLTVTAARFHHLFNEYTIRNVVIVADETFERLYSKGRIVKKRGFTVENEKESKELTGELIALAQRLKEEEQVDLGLSDLYSTNREELMIYGMTIFIGTFLGLVFLLCTGSIIFFKQLSEAGDDQKTYKILRNIGVNQREVKGTIAKQMLFVFALPLGVGMIHSWVAMSILDKYLNIDLFWPITTTAGAYTLIYMLYYLLTVRSYTKIVNAPS